MIHRRLLSAEFNLDQLKVGKDAFVKMLTESLKEQEEQPQEAE